MMLYIGSTTKYVSEKWRVYRFMDANVAFLKTWYPSSSGHLSTIFASHDLRSKRWPKEVSWSNDESEISNLKKFGFKD